MWLKDVQEKAYPNELREIQSQRKVKNSLVNQFKLFTDDSGLLRCGGRLQNANMPFNMKYPILLPPKHHFTA